MIVHVSYAQSLFLLTSYHIIIIIMQTLHGIHCTIIMTDKSISFVIVAVYSYLVCNYIGREEIKTSRDSIDSILCACPNTWHGQSDHFCQLT